MNKKRRITLKEPRLRKIRYELRSLLRLVWLERINELTNRLKKADSGDSEEDMPQIFWKIQKLKRGLIKHPIGCKLCGNRDIDLIYNPKDFSWYCERCYTFQQKKYRKMGNYHLYP